MRKLISILLIVVMAFSICSCDSYLVVSSSNLTTDEFTKAFPYDFTFNSFEVDQRGVPSFSINYKDDLDYYVYEINLEQKDVLVSSIDEEKIRAVFVSALMTNGSSLVLGGSGTGLFIIHAEYILTLICSSEDADLPVGFDEAIIALVSGETINVGGWTISCDVNGYTVRLTASAEITNSGTDTIFEERR